VRAEARLAAASIGERFVSEERVARYVHSCDHR
jgi:hypothetical protein